MIAEEGKKEEGYALLVKLISEGNEGKELDPDHPSFEYKCYINDMSVFDTPSSAPIVFKLVCIVVPKIMCSSMLELVHKFHFNATVMIAAASKHFL